MNKEHDGHCTAVARFLSWFWRHTHTQVAYPCVFMKLVPIPIETCTPGHGYRFYGVRVQVKPQGYPCQSLLEVEVLALYAQGIL